jgi:hypothetical protein
MTLVEMRRTRAHLEQTMWAHLPNDDYRPVQLVYASHIVTMGTHEDSIERQLVPPDIDGDTLVMWDDHEVKAVLTDDEFADIAATDAHRYSH